MPTKGPEASSVQALPMLMQWVKEARHARVLGFLPTMYKPRRAETRYWMAELQDFAERHHARVLAPIGDIASVAAWRLDGHHYAPLASQVLHVTDKPLDARLWRISRSPPRRCRRSMIGLSTSCRSAPSSRALETHASS